MKILPWAVLAGMIPAGLFTCLVTDAARKPAWWALQIGAFALILLLARLLHRLK